jgi:hypothetical protein
MQLNRFPLIPLEITVGNKVPAKTFSQGTPFLTNISRGA